MTEGTVPDGDHVVRYVKPSSIADGKVRGSAFLLRDQENTLSVNWMEIFSMDEDAQVEAVRKVVRLRLARNGRFAELQVGEVRRRLAGTIEITVLHRPLDADAGFPADPSHAEIAGLPARVSQIAEEVGDVIARCVRRLHPAVLERFPATGA